MTRLFEVCKAPKVWKELPNGSHNDTVAEPRYFQYIEQFLSEFVEIASRLVVETRLISMPSKPCATPHYFLAHMV
jgi:hypothetical protein